MIETMTTTCDSPEVRIENHLLQQVCAARLVNAGATVTFCGATYDSRLVRPRQLFVALHGEHTDGHRYLTDAVARGASCLMVERNHPALADFDSPVPMIAVDNTMDGLGRLASWYRNKFEIPFVAVTGSNGKTTTKEMIAAALSARYEVYKTPGNLNSRIGLPVSLFDLGKDHTAAVCEMGMSSRGEIDALAGIVRPRYAVFTNIAPAHLEKLGTIEEVAAAKFELLDHLPDHGAAFFCADDSILATRALALGDQARTYGIANQADLRAVDLRVSSDGTRFRIDSGEDVFLPLFGRHNVYNALAALSVARQMKVDMLAAVAALAVMVPAAQRSRIETAGPVTVIDDSYNANPQAMEAALLALAEYPASRRRVAVVGDMLELGERSALFHQHVGQRVAELALDLVVAVGPLSRGIFQAAREAGLPSGHLLHFDTADDCAGMVAAWSRPGDTILVKGSRGIALEKVVAALLGRYRDSHKEGT